ncbi:MAG TPA: hypothetical protein PKU70_07020, partial [Vicinamibacteria bacterium]|nr:hypothetical protein [Vicinamibacteria bacterium]
EGATLLDRVRFDFPLLGVAARTDLAADGVVARAELVLTALAAKPRRVTEAASLEGLRPGTPQFDQAVLDVAEMARRRCRTLTNLPGDADWRQAMIPVYVKRTLHAAIAGGGPVHHL